MGIKPGRVPLVLIEDLANAGKRPRLGRGFRQGFRQIGCYGFHESNSPDDEQRNSREDAGAVMFETASRPYRYYPARE